LFGRKADALGLTMWLMEESHWMEKKKHFRLLFIIISLLSGKKLETFWVWED